MKIGYPAVNRTPVELVFQRFAEAPCYGVYDTDSGAMEVIQNHLRHHPQLAGMVAVQALAQQGVHRLVVGHIPPHLLALARDFGIDVRVGYSGTCGEAISAIISENETSSSVREIVDLPPPSGFRFVEASHVFTGADVQYSDWDFLRPLEASSGAPLDWTSPTDYSGGAYMMDVNVVEVSPVLEPVELQFGMFNMTPKCDRERLERVSFGQYCRISTAGRYVHLAAIHDMEVTTLNGGERPWDWSRAHYEPFCLIKPFGQVPYPLEIELSVDIFSFE